MLQNGDDVVMVMVEVVGLVLVMVMDITAFSLSVEAALFFFITDIELCSTDSSVMIHVVY